MSCATSGIDCSDAGVVIGQLNVNDPFHVASGQALRRERAAAGQRLGLPLSAYSEALVQPSRSGAAAVETVERFLNELAVEIVLPDIEVARAAARLRAQHGSRMRLPDALVVATAIVNRADRVVTTDARWPSDVGVTVEVLRP